MNDEGAWQRIFLQNIEQLGAELLLKRPRCELLGYEFNLLHSFEIHKFGAKIGDFAIVQRYRKEHLHIDSGFQQIDEMVYIAGENEKQTGEKQQKGHRGDGDE